MDRQEAQRERERMERQARAPPGSPDAPSGMDRATGVDDPTPRAEYRDDPPDPDPPESDDEPETVTIEVPVYPDDDGISVDALFSALDHAKAYHEHDVTDHYWTLYDRMREDFRMQISRQMLDDE